MSERRLQRWRKAWFTVMYGGRCLANRLPDCTLNMLAPNQPFLSCNPHEWAQKSHSSCYGRILVLSVNQTSRTSQSTYDPKGKANDFMGSKWPIGSQLTLPLLGEFAYGWLIHELHFFPVLFMSREFAQKDWIHYR